MTGTTSTAAPPPTTAPKTRRWTTAALIVGTLAVSTLGVITRSLWATPEAPKTTALIRRLEGEVDTAAPGEKEAAAIVTLVSNLDKDVNQLCTALKTLVFLHGDLLESPRSPVLVFHESLTHEQQTLLRACTDRMISFNEVFFHQFPNNFDRYKEEESSAHVPFTKEEGRTIWGHHQMIRFWTTGIWRHPAIEPYDVIMRLDADMCFFEGNPFLPHLATHHKIYHSYFGGAEPEPKYVEGLYKFALDHMQAEGITPSNPEMWELVEKVNDKTGSLPLFQTSVEVSRKNFMQRADVDKWHTSLTEREPFGVYRHRWSDGVTRFLTMAMFSIPGEVQIMREQEHFKLYHGNCNRGDFDELLSANQFSRYAESFLGLSLYEHRMRGAKSGVIAWRKLEQE